jgi:hypothetical protein
MSENVGASTARNPKGLHGLYRDSFIFAFTVMNEHSDKLYTHNMSLNTIFLKIRNVTSQDNLLAFIETDTNLNKFMNMMIIIRYLLSSGEWYCNHKQLLPRRNGHHVTHASERPSPLSAA